MKCTVCGGVLTSVTTDLPFKISDKTIVILKNLPVLQCDRCAEYVIEDHVFRHVEGMLFKVDSVTELEILPYAA